MPFGDPVDLGKVPSIITEDAQIITTLGGGYCYLIFHMDSGWLMICHDFLVSKPNTDPVLSVLTSTPRCSHTSGPSCYTQHHPLKSLSDRPQAWSCSCSGRALAVGLVASVAHGVQILTGIAVLSNSHSITL